MLRNLFAVSFVFLAACSSGSNDPGTITGCGAGASCIPQVRNAKPGLGKAVVIGDSLAAGTGSTDPAVTPAGCLANAFGQPVVDNSKPGRTSIEVLTTSQASLDEQPKIIFISSGGNDAILDVTRPGTYDAQKSLDEMQQLFDRATKAGALVVYLGLNPPFKGGERLPQIASMARAMGVVVVDGMKDFWGNTDLMSDDIHPNDKGYQIMCDRTLAALKGFYP